MQFKTYDVFVWDCHNECTVIVKTVKVEAEANSLVNQLEKLGIDACYGCTPLRIVNNRCIYEED